MIPGGFLGIVNRAYSNTISSLQHQVSSPASGSASPSAMLGPETLKRKLEQGDMSHTTPEPSPPQGSLDIFASIPDAFPARIGYLAAGGRQYSSHCVDVVIGSVE